MTMYYYSTVHMYTYVYVPVVFKKCCSVNRESKEESVNGSVIYIFLRKGVTIRT